MDKKLNFSENFWILNVRLIEFTLLLGLTACESAIVQEYEATVKTSLTWQTYYYESSIDDKRPRTEKFASTSLLTRNGIRPDNAVIGPDDKGLWWPALPPKPTIDELEERKRPGEVFERAELLRSTEYQITYAQENKMITLPTNYQVYRQVARAYPKQKPLRLTFGITNTSVEKAEPIN